MRAGDLTEQKLLVPVDRLSHLLGSFVEKFKAEVSETQLHHPGNILGAGLCQGVENSVTAAEIRFDWMFRPDTIA